jgi:cyclase
MRPRIIPCLLLRGQGLVKTVGFKKHTYIGDPINTVRIFNEKEVDELVLLDISANEEGRGPSFEKISEIASEAFMPMSYGGGIRSVDEAMKVLTLGFEKVVINAAAIKNPNMVRQLADLTGNQSVVISIDVKKTLFGRHEVYSNGGAKSTGLDPVNYAVKMQEMGAGEIFLNSIDRDGKMQGYDLELIKTVTASVDIPVIVCGGAGNLAHFSDALRSGAAAVAAGSFFVFHGRHRAVLISYPADVSI